MKAFVCSCIPTERLTGGRGGGSIVKLLHIGIEGIPFDFRPIYRCGLGLGAWAVWPGRVRFFKLKVVEDHLGPASPNARGGPPSVY